MCVLVFLPSLSLALSGVHLRAIDDLRQAPEEGELLARLEMLKQDEDYAKQARSVAEAALKEAFEAEQKYQKDFGGPPPQHSDQYLYINRSAVKMPSFWAEDYTWGHGEIFLYPEGEQPGARDPFVLDGITYDDSNASESVFNRISESDPSGGGNLVENGCTALNHLDSGHIMSVSKNATIVPFIVDKKKYPAGSDAAVLVIPGGGGQLLAWDTEGISVAQWLNEIGINAFVLQYRTPSDHDIDLMDAQRAMSLLRHNAPQYGINANRIGAAGFSHGGYVALQGLVESQRAYARIDDVDDVYYAPNFLILAYPETPHQSLIPISGSNYAEDLLQRLPPTFWAHSLADRCVRVFNQPFIDAMANHSVPQVQMRIYQQGSHSFASCELEPELRGMDVCEWKLHAREFLNERVLNSPASTNAY